MYKLKTGKTDVDKPEQNKNKQRKYSVTILCLKTR